MFKKVALIFVASLLLVGMACAQPGMGQGQGRGQRMGMGPCGMGMGPCGPAMPMGRRQTMGPKVGPGLGPIWKDKELLKKAGISEEQANKLRDMHFQSQRDRIKLGTDMKLKQLEIAELMDTDKPDEGKILAKAKEISALREKMYLQGLQQGLNMKKLITPEQEQKLREIMLQPRSDLGPPPGDMMFGCVPGMMCPDPSLCLPPPMAPVEPAPPGGQD